MKLSDTKIISLIEKIGINQKLNIPYRMLNFELKNEYSKIKMKLKPNFIILIPVFCLFVITISSIGYFTNSKYGGILILLFIMLLFYALNPTSKKIGEIVFKKTINEFTNLIKKAKIKTLKNELNSTNQDFIKELYKIQCNYNSREQAKNDLKFEMKFTSLELSLTEYEYLINEINKKYEGQSKRNTINIDNLDL